jgi:hypothetical protein
MESFWLPEDPDDPRMAAIFDDVLPKGWDVWIFLDSEDGRPIVWEIRVAPSRTGKPYREAPDGGITSQHRTLLNIDELRLRAFQVVADNFAQVSDRPHWRRDVAVWQTIEAAESALGDPQSPGRRPRTPTLYARVAASYLRQASRNRRVYEAMHEMDYPFYHQDTLRDLVKECRKQGYLTAAPKGRAGGQLTDKALRVLNRNDMDGGVNE